jgi:hypothetical protein
MTVTPLMMKMALAHYATLEPERFFPPDTWNSAPAAEARRWLINSDLVDTDLRPTEKMRAWMERVLATPLPVAETRWVFPGESLITMAPPRPAPPLVIDEDETW